METVIKHIIPYFTENPIVTLVSNDQAYVKYDKDPVYSKLITESNYKESWKFNWFY